MEKVLLKAKILIRNDYGDSRTHPVKSADQQRRLLRDEKLGKEHKKARNKQTSAENKPTQNNR